MTARTRQLSEARRQAARATKQRPAKLVAEARSPAVRRAAKPTEKRRAAKSSRASRMGARRGSRKASPPVQLTLPTRGRGGRRPGAGRPRGRSDHYVPHVARQRVTRHEAVHVTLRLVDGLPSLRRAPHAELLLRIFAAERDAKGFRLVHYAIRSNHLHLICEANETRALSRGVQRLAARCARRLNERLGRRGRTFRDRFHGVVISTPRQMRNVLRYVLLNEHKDRARAQRALQGVGSGDASAVVGLRCALATLARRASTSVEPTAWAGRMVGVDHFSSALYFDGFANVGPLPEEPPLEPGTRVVDERGPPVAPARSWLLRVGWRRYGLIHTGEYAPLRPSDS